MKTIFIVNPRAGSGKRFEKIMDSIATLSKRVDVDVYVTKAGLDAKHFVNKYCKKNGPARFIACGGDGTFNEVLNGTIDCDEAQIGIVPIGTGNDFCRNFDNAPNFYDLEKQIYGECVKCDAIRYNTKVDDELKSGYCANMFNVGFDCAVADMTDRVREKTFIWGPMSYIVSVFINLLQKKPSNLHIEIDGIKRHSGELLLTSIANGSYCGGGLKTNPVACVNDGFININIVKNISRMKFLYLLPKYIKGTYLKLKNIEKIVTSEKCHKVKITSLINKIRISIDGEITDAGTMEFEIVHNAFNFVVPSFKTLTEQYNTEKIYN